jgi:hypothetical protein
VGQSSTDTRRLIQIAALVVLGLVAACGVCGTVLLAASFFVVGR